MSLLRKLLAIIALLIFICILAAAALVMFVDPNKLKPVIISEINKQSDYQTVIDGNLSWSFYPRLGVKVEHMTLTTPGQKTPFLDLNNLTIAASIMQILHRTELLEGDIRIASLSLANLKAQNAHIGVHWKDNVLTLQPIFATVYEGTCRGIAHGRTQSTHLVWDWLVECDRVQIKPFLQSLNGSRSKITISGAGQIRFQGQTQGKSREELIRQLNGISNINVNNGALEGVDLNYYIEAATAFLTKQPVPTASSNNQTRFDSMTATAVIKNGVANIDNLLLVSPVFATKGTGSIDLAAQKIDYELEATPLRTQKIRWMIPVQIVGDLQNPTIRLDTLKMNTLLANEQFEKVKIKVREEIKKLPAKADKLIKHLLGG